MILTYNSPDIHLGGVTYGVYSDSIVVKEHFVLHVPPPGSRWSCSSFMHGDNNILSLASLGVTKGKRVGVVGLGGLGHMAVKFAHALGAHVAVFTTSLKKKEDALRLGADEVVVSSNTNEMRKHIGSFDFIIDTVSAEHDINTYLQLLRPDGNLTLVGAPDSPHAVSARSLLFNRRSLSGSLIGISPKHRRCLNFAASIRSPRM